MLPLLYDAINGFSSFLFFLPLSYSYPTSVSVSLIYFFLFPTSLPFHFSVDFQLSGSLIGNFKLTLHFIIKPHCDPTALCCLQPNTHIDKQTHMQAHGNIPPEVIIQDHCQQSFSKNKTQKKKSWKKQKQEETDRNFVIPSIQRPEKKNNYW